ncbi:MAG TPA: hypothetical protein DD391_04470 [Clostridiales bacterium]|mgnify:FL=1|uniref:Stage III sporulation protein AF n=1 Tax=Congzhengia minquanensis TaxID=2763657 RepID=A0A926DL76_9FIRM|nr:stage III sporulation protein AF [Congzhengia minquanensis]MBC8539769.1 stage III sporulation protein AF [Congzhengia minquanensis]HBL81840.1 hypothetical protein [Clostridiales bacterium]
MADYLKMVIAAVICVSLVCGILPRDGAGKYAGFAAGLIVIAIVVSPLFKLSGTLNLQLSDIETQELSVKGASYLMDEFEKTLSVRIAEKLKTETGRSFQVTVEGKTDETGEITGVARVGLSPYSADFAKIVAEYIDISQDKVVEQ